MIAEVGIVTTGLAFFRGGICAGRGTGRRANCAGMLWLSALATRR